MKRKTALLLVAILTAGCLSACGTDTTNNSASTNNNSTASTSTSGTENSEGNTNVSATVSAGPDDTTEHEEFDIYYNYAAWSHVWGDDEYSAYLSEKFNVSMNWSAGENDPDAKLNLMMSSGDMPDMIITERGTIHNKVARAGMLVDLETLMYDGCSFAEDIPESVRNMLKVDGVLYGIPNWARSGATGGNYQWMINSQIYEKIGAENIDITTLEGLHDFALAAKEGGYTSYNGGSLYPLLVTNTDNGYYVYYPMFRALGGRALQDNYWTQEDGVIEFGVDNEKFVEALRIANTWYNEGLFSGEVFTDSSEQFLEKLTNGRAALLWYDYSQDNTNNFRRITQEQSGGEADWLVLGYDIGEKDQQFPGAEGVTVTYGDEAGGVGWNVNSITTACSNPQRLFDVFTYMLTPEGSVYMQYGPEGGTMLESVDWSGSMPVPILKKDVSLFTSAETDAAGAWFWSQPAQSDYVDGIKFALNDALPAESQDWVVTRQAHLSSYDADEPHIGQKFMTDQLTNVTGEIDSQDELGICLKNIEDKCKEMLPKIIMASTEADFNKMVEELSTYAHSQRVDEINEVWQAKFDDNVATQGFDAYSDEYDVYKLHS